MKNINEIKEYLKSYNIGISKIRKNIININNNILLKEFDIFYNKCNTKKLDCFSIINFISRKLLIELKKEFLKLNKKNESYIYYTYYNKYKVININNKYLYIDRDNDCILININKKELCCDFINRNINLKGCLDNINFK